MQIIHVINLSGKVRIGGLGTCIASVTSRAWEEEGDIEARADGKCVRGLVRSQEKLERMRLLMWSRCDDVADRGCPGDFIIGKDSVLLVLLSLESLCRTTRSGSLRGEFASNAPSV